MCVPSILAIILGRGYYSDYRLFTHHYSCLGAVFMLPELRSNRQSEKTVALVGGL
jgi:hypothetical protein